jgi:two-component system, NarL family, sensor histidine kinase UhpB
MALISNEKPLPAISQRHYVPLLYRVAGLNAVLLAFAVGVTIAVLDPRRVSSFRLDEAGVLLVVVLAAAVTLNVYLVRRIVAPVQTVTALARRADLTGDAERMPAPAGRSEAGELALTFNEMLDRLQAERREATGRVLAGQEAERLRIAQELHDQIGQELTAVLLSLARVESRAPPSLKDDVILVQEAVRSSLENVRQIAIELRPEALDDLGLDSALAVLCERFAERTGLRITENISPELPALPPEIELVLYRVAQEALTNVVRHSGADEATLDLEYHAGALALTVSDGGRGLPAGYTPGTGMRGMRERATLIGAHLTIEPRSGSGGCRVTLAVNLPERG